MLQTYKAVLRGDRLEWRGEAPEQTKGEQAVMFTSLFCKMPMFRLSG